MKTMEEIDWSKLMNAQGGGSGYMGNYLGTDFNWLRQQFKDQIEGGSEYGKMMLDQGKKDIGLMKRQGLEQLDVLGAQSGFRGANANLVNSLFETGATQLGKLEMGKAQLDEQVRGQGLASLMGLTQFEGGMKLDVDKAKEQARQYEKTFNENVRQFGLEYALKQRQLELAEEEASGSFGGFLGDVFGTGLGFLTGGLGASASNWLAKLLKIA